MSDINEKTKLPLSLVITIVTLAVGLAFNIGVSHFRLQNLEKQQDQFRSSSLTTQTKRQDMEMKIQRLDITLDNINKRLESIDRKLDRMERK